VDASSSVQARAEQLADTVFLGGPVADFEAVGRLQLIVLLREGLAPRSNLLDVGCGSLRGGYWFIHLLEPGRYYGIEPDRAMLQAGLDDILEPEVVAAKRPTFAHNDDFDLSVFGVEFDYVVARSVWTHAAKHHITTMLDSFRVVAAPGAKLLASYLPAVPLVGSNGRTGPLGVFPRDYKGTAWVGHSHERTEGGLVGHSRSWIFQQCHERGLSVQQLRHGVVNRQKWLRITAGS
jgi:SAM-dependent methyltransferase